MEFKVGDIIMSNQFEEPIYKKITEVSDNGYHWVYQENLEQEIYREDSLAIYVKGRLVYGVHPKNVNNFIDQLETGELKFDWSSIKQYLD